MSDEIAVMNKGELVSPGCLIDDHGHLRLVGTEHRLLVVGGHVTVEEHLVREPAAAAGAHRDAQCQVGGAFGLEQFLDLGCGGVGEGDHGGVLL